MDQDAAQAHTLFEVRDGIATLTLNDGARINPLTEGLLRGCLSALAAVGSDASVRVLIVKANGAGFSSGANLRDLDPKPDHADGADAGGTVPERVDALLRDFGHHWVRGIRALDVPVIAAVHGVVAGGGVGFALASDLVVAARSSYFYLPFVPALGLVPDMGAGWFLPRRIGEQRAMAFALLGDKVGAEDAERWGLIYKCVDDARLPAEIDQLAARLAALPAHGIREMRDMMDRSRDASLPDFLEYERARQRALIAGESFSEGVAAFKQRRPPQFSKRG